MVLLLTLLLAQRPKMLTIRLSEEEAKQLALLTALRTFRAKKRVTIRACIASMLEEAVIRKFVLPAEKTTPVLAVEDIAHRISFATDESIYKSIDTLRGDRKIRVDKTGAELLEKLAYGDADLIREVIKLMYNDKLHELQKLDSLDKT